MILISYFLKYTINILVKFWFEKEESNDTIRKSDIEESVDLSDRAPLELRRCKRRKRIKNPDSKPTFNWTSNIISTKKAGSNSDNLKR